MAELLIPHLSINNLVKTKEIITAKKFTKNETFNLPCNSYNTAYNAVKIAPGIATLKITNAGIAAENLAPKQNKKPLGKKTKIEIIAINQTIDKIATV